MTFNKDGSYSIGLFELIGLHGLSRDEKVQLANNLQDFLSKCSSNVESVDVDIYGKIFEIE